MPISMTIENSCPLITASDTVGAGRREKEKRNIQALPQTAPVLRGRKGSRSHGINYEKITVSLRQLRRRRSLLRLRPWHLTEALERMCDGRGESGLGT
ncbi:hypothetical protein NN561_017384 [Cricetulus griseus]